MSFSFSPLMLKMFEAFAHFVCILGFLYVRQRLSSFVFRGTNGGDKQTPRK